MLDVRRNLKDIPLLVINQGVVTVLRYVSEGVESHQVRSSKRIFGCPMGRPVIWSTSSRLRPSSSWWMVTIIEWTPMRFPTKLGVSSQ